MVLSLSFDAVAMELAVDSDGSPCPSEAQLDATLKSMSADGKNVATMPGSVHVRFEGRGTGYVASVTWRDKEGRIVGEREIVSDDPSCEKLGHAVALALTLAAPPPPQANPKPKALPPVKPARREEPKAQSEVFAVGAGATAQIGMRPQGSLGPSLRARFAVADGVFGSVGAIHFGDTPMTDESFAVSQTLGMAGVCGTAVTNRSFRLLPCLHLEGGVGRVW